MRRYRQKVLTCCALIAITAVITGLIVSSFCGIRIRSLSNETEKLSLQLKAVQAREKVVMCATKDLDAGSSISEEDVAFTLVAADMVPADTLLTIEEAVGKTARIPISKNSYITGSMLYDSSPLGTERAVEYSCIEMNGNISRGSYVDVRICFDDGSDYIVLAKKRIESISDSGRSVILYVDPRELLVMGSAVSELKNSPGTRLYAVEYPQGEIQEAAVPDYVPGPAVVEIIRNMEK